MKYKILMYDGHPVKLVNYERIVLVDQKEDCPKLLDHSTTIDDLIRNIPYKGIYHTRTVEFYRKCDLVEVELRFTQEV